MAPKAAAGKAGKKAEEAAVPAAPVTGSGTFYFKNGATYEGEWKQSASTSTDGQEAKPDTAEAAEAAPERVRHGKGTYREGQYCYKGEWLDDKMHGTGKFTFASGAVFEGSWLNGEYQGRGCYSWPDGRKYEGEWQQCRMHGQGVYTDKDGHGWTGQFFNGSGPGLTCLLE
ncbi:hypothetical protein WJX72_007698 [[Myrmecia] bisecta]|uniref:MORN repeat-containing protein n=1 Tax=[Myrmecia] bisecta TaxID=41462 RepID=A0AAW1R8R6_9CHLO